MPTVVWNFFAISHRLSPGCTMYPTIPGSSWSFCRSMGWMAAPVITGSHTGCRTRKSRAITAFTSTMSPPIITALSCSSPASSWYTLSSRIPLASATQWKGTCSTEDWTGDVSSLVRYKRVTSSTPSISRQSSPISTSSSLMVPSLWQIWRIRSAWGRLSFSATLDLHTFLVSIWSKQASERFSSISRLLEYISLKSSTSSSS